MNEQYNFDPMTGEPVAKTKKREFSAKERAMVWFSIPVGYLFFRACPVWEHPLTGLVFTLCLFLFAFVFFSKRKRKPRSLFYPVSALAVSLSFVFSSSPALLSLAFIYVCIAFSLFCQTGCETALEDRAGVLYIFEAVKALFAAPFENIGAAVKAAGSGKGGKRFGKALLTAVIGIGAALIPTAVVMWLLSFDSNFTSSIDRIFRSFFDEIFSRFWSLFLGVPIAMYIFASVYSAAHPEKDSFDRKNCLNITNKLKFAPVSVGAIAVAPLLFIYCVFIAAQRDYYLAILTSSLPDAYTFAEFARDGFFRLCAVAAINAAMLIALRVFSKKTKNGNISPVVRIYTVILSLMTVIISVTAISQMIMYVSTYGLTRLRLYTLWFMGLLILLFLAAILKQLIEKLPFAATALTVFALCFGILAIPDTDGIIARHNYNCHLAGTTYELDVGYLGDLIPSSVPVLCEIAENDSLSEEVRTNALSLIGLYASQEKRSGNLPSVSAAKAYDSLGREKQLKAAVALDAYCPQVYTSSEEQLLENENGYCDLTVYSFDKKDSAVFTGNDCYTRLDLYTGTLEKKAIEEYAALCKASGKKSALPFGEKDLIEWKRFYVAGISDPEDDEISDFESDDIYNYDSDEISDFENGRIYETASVYIYDTKTAKLAVFHFSVARK